MLTREKRCLHRRILMCLIFLVWYISLSIPALAADATVNRSDNPSQGKQTDPRLIRASKMVDQSVYNERGEEIGDVDDLIMSRNGKIKKVILSIGEFLQTGEKLVAVPFKSLKIDERGRIFYNATKEQIESHPGFSYRSEQLYGEPFYPLPAYSMRGELPPSRTGRNGPSHAQGKCRSDLRPWEWEYFPDRLRISGVLDRGILDRTGREVADLTDLMISPEGRAEQIILDVGGFLGIGEKLVAVPFRPLKVTDLGIVCHITKEQLERSPTFTYEKR